MLFFCLAIFAAPVRVARDVHSRASGINNARTLVRDSAGNLYAAYSASDGAHYQIYIARSSDGGASWNPAWGTITSNTLDDRDPSLAVDPSDTLHLVWAGNISTGNDGDLLYRKYPGGSNQVISARTGYPGAHCPSLAVDSGGDLHVVWTGCPSSWLVRYLHFDRASGSWDAPVDIGTRVPSRWPSVAIDGADKVHIVYRNEYSGNYRCAHKTNQSGAWRGFNGADHDTLDQFVTASSALEFTSAFVDTLENLHAVWLWDSSFSAPPDTLRYRRYSGGWGPVRNVFGSPDVRISMSGDVVADEGGNLFILYHNGDSIFCRESADLGASFIGDTLLQADGRALYPNARGSRWPAFNRPSGGCIDYLWTWDDPDSTVNWLMFDRMCLEPESIESTSVCAHFIEPAESSITSCSDQAITAFIGCCAGDTFRIFSDTSSVEYFDSTAMDWVTPVLPDSSIWSGFHRIDGAEWVWFEYPASSYESRWFRSILDGCDEIDSAYIRVQCDNKAYIYVNGTYVDTTHGNSGGGYDGWRTMYEFDLTPYLHGGADTVEIIGENASGYAGLLFEIVEICAGGCCGEIDPTSILFSLNGEYLGTGDAELSWDGDSTLTYQPIPPDSFVNGDTVTACLEAAADTCSGSLDSAVCLEFFVDLQPPVVLDIIPPPDTVSADTTPDFHIYIIDSIAGVDTSSLVLTVNGAPESAFVDYSSAWHIFWTPDSSLHRGDTLELCISAEDSTDYCPDNRLDTCWSYFVRPCAPLAVWLDCPLPCYEFSSCSTGAAIFGVSDTAGFGLDTSRAFFTAIQFHTDGSADTTRLESPSPFIEFDFAGDTTIAVSGLWQDGDSVAIILDSLFSTGGCPTTGD